MRRMLIPDVSRKAGMLVSEHNFVLQIPGWTKLRPDDR